MAQESRGSTSRRSFLKAVGGAVGAAALPLGRGAAGQGRVPGGGHDVIVIGGGFAGVTAARELGHAGLRVLLLEARNRLGGRTFTARVGGELFELGGTWVHSTQPHVFAEVNRYGLELLETQGDIPQHLLWWDGEEARDAGVLDVLPVLKEAVCASGEATPDAPFTVLQGFALLQSQMVEFHSGARAAFPRPFDPFYTDGWKEADTLSIRDRLDQLGYSDSRRGLLEGVLGASAHGDFDQAGFVEMLRWWALSGHDLQRYSDSVARFRLRDGTASLIDAMIDDGRPDVRLATPVARVAQDGERIEVTTKRGEHFTARAAIAALPMNVLADIDFSPPLQSAKEAASRERHAGAGSKVYIRVRGELPRLTLFAPESEPFASVFTMGGSGGHGTELVAFGTDPSRIDVHSAAAVQQALRRFLPDVEVIDTLAYDWHLDPYSRGTWCILRKGQMTKYLAALREPHGRVHFAGGDIALGWRGFIDGAIESGCRTAHEVVADLNGHADRAAVSDRAAEADHRARSARAAEADRPTGSAAGVAASAPAPARQCLACHPADPSGKPGVAPNLHGVHGRPAAGTPGFPYSDALRSRTTTWTDEELDAFLADPAAYAPGTTMPFAGLKDPKARAAVIRFLRTLK